jgi:arabinose-5-phosphate isomerase
MSTAPIPATSSAELAVVIRDALTQQGQALLKLADEIDPAAYQKALALMYACSGHVIICGMGKSGHVGRKLSATLASTGTPSFFLHPAEAFHGDLGMITPNDVVILISNSGETDEILKVIPSLKSFGNKIISMTGGLDSTMARNSDVTLGILMDHEACPNNLAPTTSTTLTMAIGDALAIALMRIRDFQPQDFARYHPGGSLGRRLLTRVRDVMQPEVPTVHQHAEFRQVISTMTHGRQGMAAVVDDAGKLVGIITDGDLRRALEKFTEFSDKVAADMMTAHPITVSPEMMLADAEALMNQKRISCLIVADPATQPLGLIRIFD